MNYKNKQEVQDLFANKTFIDSNNHHFQTKTLMYRFLSEVERITDEKKITRRKLAELVGTSPSYITQLYRGNKVISLELLAKIEKALEFEFKIIAQTEADKMIEHLTSNFQSIEVTNRFWLNSIRKKSFSRFAKTISGDQKYNSKVQEDSKNFISHLKIVA